MPSKKTKKFIDKKDTKKKHLTKKPVFYFFAVIIIIIIAVSFIGGPLLGKFLGGGNKTVYGSYAGKEIALFNSISNYFFQKNRINSISYEQTLEFYREYYFVNLSEQEVSDFEQRLLIELWNSSFNDTVLHRAIMHEAEKSGIIITENRIIESFFEFGHYIDQNGDYDPRIYSVTNKADRIEYQKIQLEQLIDMQYNEDIETAATLGMSENEKNFIMNMAVTERKFSFVTYDFDNYPLEQIIAYASENLDKFKKIQLSRITITSSREEAEKVRNLAINGEMSFEDLAREYSDIGDFYKDKGGDMGWQYAYDLDFIFNSEETVNKILDLSEGQISNEIYEIELVAAKSWVFYRANSYVNDPDPSDTELITEIKEYISLKDQNVIETYYMEQAEEFKLRAEEVGFSQAALEFDLYPAKETNYFPINYGNIYQGKSITVNGEASEVLSSVSNNEYFYEELFSLREGDISEPIVLSNHLIIVKMIDERTAPAEDMETLETTISSIKQTSMQKDLSGIVIDQNLFVDRSFEVLNNR